MKTSSAKIPAKSFPNTAAGRNAAYQTAKNQGEKSITFQLKKPAPSKTKR